MTALRQRESDSQGAFTLLEVLVAFAVFSLLLTALLTITSRVTALISAPQPSFQEARTAFETMNRILSQAVLNTYWDYDSIQNPRKYLRASELHFVVGAGGTLTSMNGVSGSAVFCQAPLGVTGNGSFKARAALLNNVGFYVQKSASKDTPGFVGLAPAETAASRLWMFLEPAEETRTLSVFNGDAQSKSRLDWLADGLQRQDNHHILANNVALLLIRCSYRDANGNTVVSYAYDSRPKDDAWKTAGKQPVEMHQFPEALQLTLIALDERTAQFLREHANYELIPSDRDLFVDAADYAEDIAALKQYFDSRPFGGRLLGYRIFEATVDIGSAKWSL